MSLSKKKIALLLSALLVFQSAILVGKCLNSYYPLWYGQKVFLEVRPVDPRSLFRGNYARLDYPIGDLELSEFGWDTKEAIRAGEEVYLSLKELDGVWYAHSVDTKAPEDGLFIKGINHNRWRSTHHARVRYGIEAYFATPEKALEIERELPRWGFVGPVRPALAEVMIAPNGQAALVAVHTQGLQSS